MSFVWTVAGNERRHTGRRALILMMTTALVALSGPSATAVGVSITGSAVLNSGQSRSIGVAWGSNGPYNVNFQCNVPGCANFVSSSTSTTSLGRTVSLATCTQQTRSHTVTVRDRSGASASASSQTTWRAGACR